MTRKITKTDYERYLNDLGVPEHDKAENGGRCRTKNYGTWLRRNYPIAFNLGYEEYLREIRRK